MLYDLNRCYSSDDSILEIYRTGLGNIEGIIDVSFPYNMAVLEFSQNGVTVGFALKIKYLQDRTNIAGSGTVINPPNI